MVTPVNEGQASAMQQILTRFWEELTRQQAWLLDKKFEDDKRKNKNCEIDKKENLLDSQTKSSVHHSPSTEQPNPSKPSPEIKVYHQNQLIYEHSKGSSSNNFSSQLAGQLEVLQLLPLETKIPNSANLRVEILFQENDKISSKTVFETDRTGTIKTNIFAESIKQKKGSQIIDEQLGAIKDDSFSKEILYLKTLKNDLENLYNSQQKLLERFDQQEQQFNKLITQRQQNLHQPRWWQKLNDSWQNIKDLFKQQRQKAEAAKTILTLFRREVSPDGKIYEGAEYTIIRDRNRYTLQNNNQETKLIQFRVAQSGTIEIENSQLQPFQYQELTELKQSLQKNQELPSSFASLETLANSRHVVTERIAAQLTQLARKEGRAVRKEGEIYNLFLSPDGEIQIWAKDNRGHIYGRYRNGDDLVVHNKMRTHDLTFFKRQLDRLQMEMPKEEKSNTPQIQQPAIAQSRSRLR
jgi:hypothetical protein